MTVTIQLRSNYNIQCSFSWGGDFTIASIMQESFLFSSNKQDVETAHLLEESFPNLFKRLDFYTELGKEKVILTPNYDKLAVTIK